MCKYCLCSSFVKLLVLIGFLISRFGKTCHCNVPALMILSEGQIGRLLILFCIWWPSFKLPSQHTTFAYMKNNIWTFTLCQELRIHPYPLFWELGIYLRTEKPLPSYSLYPSFKCIWVKHIQFRTRVMAHPNFDRNKLNL